MAITCKIHPAISTARLGDNFDEFFIGPERPYKYPDPSGGFKDSQCRVKRQAARCRIFAHDNVAGTAVEIDDSTAEITWTVHLAKQLFYNDYCSGYSWH